MAYELFVKDVERANFLADRDKALVFGSICVRDWEGEIKKRGDTINVQVAGTPTIYDLDKDATYTLNQVGTGSIAGTGRDVLQKGLPDPEEIANAEMQFKVNKVYAFNYLVGDIDQQLSSKKGLMSEYRKKEATAMAEKQDLYIATKIVADTSLLNPNYTSGTVVLSANGTASDGTNTNVLDVIDDAVRVLNERNVGDSVQLVAIVSPKVWRYIKQAYIALDTDNSLMLANRKCGMYNDVKIVKSNNTTISSTEYMFITTEDAVAFFDPLTLVEPYRPEKGFSDAIKGMNFFDAAVIKPKEIITTIVTYEVVTSA